MIVSSSLSCQEFRVTPHRCLSLPEVPLVGLLLREHQLHLETQLPVRALVWMHHIVVAAKLRVHRKLAEMKYFIDAAT